jgi:hypothetical protein
VRVFGQWTLGVSLCAAAAAVSAQPQSAGPPSAQPPARSADQILVETRTALGGDELGSIKTFVTTGRTRRLSGNNLVPIEFEISCELPDKYVRKDEIPAQENEPTSSGFNGTSLVQIPAPPPMPAGPPRAGGAPPPGAPPGMPGAPGARGPIDPRASRTASAKQDFARLTLGMFAQSFAGYPLTFSVAGRAEAPQGTADVLDAKGEGFAMKFFVNSQTHLPVMVRWQTPRSPQLVVITVPGQAKPVNLPPGALVVEGPAAPAATATAEEKDAFAKAVAALRTQTLAKPVDHTLFYLDYRDAGGGVKFPFKLRRAVGADTIEETTFDGFRLNAKIDPRRFEPVK